MTLTCVACDADLAPAMPDQPETNQPYGGTVFRSHGQYGSTVFDPADGSYLEVNICDPCLLAKTPAIRHSTLVRREKAVYETGPWEPYLGEE